MTLLKFKLFSKLLIVFLVAALTSIQTHSLASQTEIPITNLINEGDKKLELLDFEKAAEIYQEALTQSLIQSDPMQIAIIRNKLTEALWKCEKIEEAERYGYDNLEFCLKNWGWNHQETAITLENLGAIANFIVPSDIQLTFYMKALEINRNLHGNTHSSVAMDLQWISWYYEKYADSVNSRKYMFESLAVWKKNREENHPDLAELYRFIGLFYRRYDVFDSSLYFFTKARKLFDAKYGEENVYSIKCRINLSVLYEFANQRDTSITMYHQTLGLLQKIMGYSRNVKIMAYYSMADNYFNLHDLEKALDNVQIALSTFFPDFKPKSGFDNPEINWTRYYPFLFHTAYIKLQILRDFKRTPENERLLEKSMHELNQILDNLQDQTRLKTLLMGATDSSENFLIRDNIYLVENARSLFIKTSDTSYISSALTYLSKNRSFLELTTPFKNSALLNLFPTDVITKRDKILRTISDLQMESNCVVSPERKKQILNSKNEQRILLSALNFSVNTNSDLVSKLIKEKCVVYLGDVQKKLKNNQVMICFSEMPPAIRTDPRIIFQIVVTPNNADIIESGSFELSTQISEYRKAILEIKPVKQIDSIGYLLFQSIFERYHKQLTGKELIIIPSTQISSIPIELLPTTSSDNPEYFIQETLITYLFSINDFLEKSTDFNFDQNKMLSVVPSFNKNRKQEIAQLVNRDSSLIDLPGALVECQEISKIIPSDIIKGTSATENLFKSNYSSYPVIHLSTHGISSSKKYYADELAFSGSDLVDDGYLRFNEILNMNFNTEMIVLSACKTGMGNIHNAVANMNLGWSFKQAGAKSVLISLWDANDFTSSQIMPEFYRYLSQGFTRPEALRMAKLKYLEQADVLMKHPFYWAGFQYYGKNEPVDAFLEEHNKLAIHLAFLLLITLAITGLRFFRQKRRSL